MSLMRAITAVNRRLKAMSNNEGTMEMNHELLSEYFQAIENKARDESNERNVYNSL